MYCSQCGFNVSEGAKFCFQCGAQISQGAGIPQTNVVYESHVPYLSSDDQLLRLFVGEEKQDYYLKKWSQGDRGWNWAAFFLAIFWLGYRKMYKPVFVMIGIYLIIDLVVAFIGFDDTNLNNWIGIAAGMTLGFWGNYFYRQHAIMKINKIKNQYRDPGMVMDQVRLQGGGSWKGVLTSLGLFTGYILLSMAIFSFAPSIYQPSITKPAGTVVKHPINTKAEIKAEINDLIKKNTQALEEQDLDGYMSTIYKADNSALYDQTQQMLENLFVSFDLSYEIGNIEFLSVSNNKVKVRLTQTTKLVDGGAFRDNTSIFVHTFKKQDGEWKFFESETESIDYLDEENASDVTQENIRSYTDKDYHFSFQIPSDWERQLTIQEGRWPQEAEKTINVNYKLNDALDVNIFSIIVMDGETSPAKWEETLWTYITAKGGKTFLYATPGDPPEELLKPENSRILELVQKMVADVPNVISQMKFN